MAIAFVTGQKAGASSSAGGQFIEVAFPGNVTAADLVVVGGTCSGSFTITGVTDSLGNGYTRGATAASQDSIGLLEGWYSFNIAGGADTPRVTFSSASATFRVITVSEYSGVKSDADPLDKSDADPNAGSASSAITTPNVTPVEDGELIWGYVQSNTGTPAANSPFTTLSQPGIDVADEFFVQSTAAAVHSDFVCTGSVNWTVLLLTFRSGVPPAVADVGIPTKGPPTRPLVGGYF